MKEGFTPTPYRGILFLRKFLFSILEYKIKKIRNMGNIKDAENPQCRDWCRGFTPPPENCILRKAKILFFLNILNSRIFRIKAAVKARRKYAMPLLVGGFTLAEVVVVVAIISIIAGLTLANYRGFGDRLAIDREAQSIASIVRQAQANGLAVKESAPGSNVFPGYGVYFHLNLTKSYILFADVDVDSLYDDPAEKVSDEQIGNNIVISDLCANQKQPVVGPCNMVNLTVVYLRPSPNVIINGSYLDVEIRIKSPRGLYKQVIIWKSGQVSIESCSAHTTYPYVTCP